MRPNSVETSMNTRSAPPGSTSADLVPTTCKDTRLAASSRDSSPARALSAVTSSAGASADIPQQSSSPCGRRQASYICPMCRNIRPLFNFEPPATDEEVFAAALQYVRKVSNQRKPSGRNLMTFDQAVQEIAAVTRRLVDSLETNADPKNREEEAAKAKARSA